MIHMKRNTRTRLIDYTDSDTAHITLGIIFFVWFLSVFEINDFRRWAETKGIHSVN